MKRMKTTMMSRAATRMKSKKPAFLYSRPDWSPEEEEPEPSLNTPRN